MTLFLLGAGFNVDAGRYRAPGGEERTYPLLADVAHLCFGLGPSEIPSEKSIEDLFADSLARNKHEPLQKLSDRLMECDWYLASRLSSSGESNCYQKFFDAFAGAHFLTFNYDSLPEIFLFRRKCWFPHDGYGVPVRVELQSLAANEFVGEQSTSMILHLHGSLCLYTSEFEIQSAVGDSFPMLVPRDRPSYSFDPDSITSCFSPNRRVFSNTGRVPIEERVTAPVPNKAAALAEPFIREAYEKACALVRDAGELIAVGYSFNAHDRASYDPVLQALLDSRERKLIIVSPNAAQLRDRIRAGYSQLDVEAIAKTLKNWAADSFHWG